MEQVASKLAESEKAFASIQKEINELNSQIAEINTNKDQLADNNKKHEAAKVQCEEMIKELEAKAIEAQSKIAAANTKVSELLIEYNSVKQKDDFIQENIRRIRQDDEKLQEELASYITQVQATGTDITKLEEQAEAIRKTIEEDSDEVSDQEEQLVAYHKERDDMTASHKEFFAIREELSEKIAGLEKAVFKLDSAIEKNTEKSDELSNYMWAEYELTLNMAAEFRDEELNDLSSLKKEITAVKAKIKSLGDVNVNAIEDYKEVSERYEFLKGQHDDIVLAEKNLLDVIEKLNVSMQEQFNTKFKEIQVMFDKVFKELFGGGRGALELVDDTNLLETGIRIIAQPPGKNYRT